MSSDDGIVARLGAIGDELKMVRHFAARLPRFLRDTIDIEAARQIARRCQAEREENFLRLVERAIFGHPASPYLPLLRMADATLEDIRESVVRKGLDATLRVLREAGVYVSFDEFKGRTPIVRQGRVFQVDAGDFDNPHLAADYYVESGGSTGAGTRVPHDLEHLAVQAAYELICHEAHGAVQTPVGVWRGVLPDGSGIDNVLRRAHYGFGTDRWFANNHPYDLRHGQAKYRLATLVTVVVARSLGVRIAWPRYVPIERADVVARWVASTLESEGACLVLASASRGLRICLAAREQGLDLRGAIFRLGGEPMTPAKIAGIESTGAKAFTTYGFSELGRIGMDCGRGLEINDLHLVDGICALIQHPHRVEGTDLEVPAFNFTSLLPTAPKILLNAESDDYGIVEERRCGCPLGELGLGVHLRQIASFRKLTGEGATLVGSEMIDILENFLPQRFGGSPLDYQLVEEEDRQGLTRLILAIDPSVEIGDVSEVVREVLARLGASSPMANEARQIWQQAKTLQVRRQKPIWTDRGKLMSLYVQKRYARSARQERSGPRREDTR